MAKKKAKKKAATKKKATKKKAAKRSTKKKAAKKKVAKKATKKKAAKKATKKKATKKKATKKRRLRRKPPRKKQPRRRLLKSVLQRKKPLKSVARLQCSSVSTESLQVKKSCVRALLRCGFFHGQPKKRLLQLKNLFAASFPLHDCSNQNETCLNRKNPSSTVGLLNQS